MHNPGTQHCKTATNRLAHNVVVSMQTRIRQAGLLLSALCLLLPLAPPSIADTAPVSNGQQGDLRIELSRPHKGGAIQVLLFNSAENFEDFRDPLVARRFSATGQSELLVADLPAGEYALLVYHDENANERLDRNFMGIPSEPIGFSNTYRPRGAPTFRNARFAFVPGESDSVAMQLERPLGDYGRIGIGAGIITRSSPYEKSTDNPLTVIPALVYIGNRVQITGPFMQIGLLDRDALRLAGTLAYRQAVYRSADSPVLAGMRNRKATAMAGLSLQIDTIAGIDIRSAYQHDVLDRIGSGEAQVSLSRPIPWDRFRFSPSIGINWLDKGITRHDFGVTNREATPQRPAFSPGQAWNIEAGFSILAEITPEITGALMTAIEWLDRDIQRSPIVDENHVLKGMAFIVYML